MRRLRLLALVTTACLASSVARAQSYGYRGPAVYSGPPSRGYSVGVAPPGTNGVSVYRGTMRSYGSYPVNSGYSSYASSSPNLGYNQLQVPTGNANPFAGFPTVGWSPRSSPFSQFPTVGWSQHSNPFSRFPKVGW